MTQEPASPASVLDLLDEADRRELERRGGRRRFKAGSTLMHEGSPGAEVLMLLSGRVKASVTNADGREVVLGFQGPGDLVGELALIDDRPRSSTVEALEPVEALAVSAPDFRALLARPGVRRRAPAQSRPALSRRRPAPDRVRLRADPGAGRGAAARARRAPRRARRGCDRDHAADLPGGARRLDRLLARGGREGARGLAGPRPDPDRAATDHGARCGGPDAPIRLSGHTAVGALPNLPGREPGRRSLLRRLRLQAVARLPELRGGARAWTGVLRPVRGRARAAVGG